MEGGREEARLFHKVGYLPRVVVIFLSKVDVDNLRGMWTIVVSPWCFRDVEVWGCVGSFGGRFGRSTTLKL